MRLAIVVTMVVVGVNLSQLMSAGAQERPIHVPLIRYLMVAITDPLATIDLTRLVERTQFNMLLHVTDPTTGEIVPLTRDMLQRPYEREVMRAEKVINGVTGRCELLFWKVRPPEQMLQAVVTHPAAVVEIACAVVPQ